MKPVAACSRLVRSGAAGVSGAAVGVGLVGARTVGTGVARKRADSRIGGVENLAHVVLVIGGAGGQLDAGQVFTGTPTGKAVNRIPNDLW